MEKRYQRHRLWSWTAGAAAARTGDEMSGPALLLAGLAATGSPASASALLAGATAAAAVGGPLVGVLLDRSPAPGRLLAAALAGHALALTAVLGCLGRVPLGWTVLIAAGAGLLAPALSGGWSARLPSVVPASALPRAGALDALTFNAAALAGPALAGGTARLAGAPAGVAVSAALICLALPAALRLPRRTAGAPPYPLAAEIAAGFRAVARVPPLARATAVTTISCAGEGMLVACAPLLGERALGGAGHGALLLAGIAAVALAAGALSVRRPVHPSPDTVVPVSALLLAAATALAATGDPVSLAVAVPLAGIGQGTQLTALFAIRHREAPARLRGQVFTTGASLKLTGFAAGAALAGPLALWSLPGALLTAAAVQLLAALPGVTPCAREAARRRRERGAGTDERP
ncbi:MFS transporter [Streptomyces amakusaensis]|uniref:MFS transporter n=1 Tax=Streptomyces amakusaensis TaxID=67271 RepID=A0ABW0AUN0_9ACTN